MTKPQLATTCLSALSELSASHLAGTFTEPFIRACENVYFNCSLDIGIYLCGEIEDKNHFPLLPLLKWIDGKLGCLVDK